MFLPLKFRWTLFCFFLCLLELVVGLLLIQATLNLFGDLDLKPGL